MAASDLTTSAELAACVGQSLLALQVTDAAIVGAVAPADPLVASVLGPNCSGGWGARSGDGAGWVLIEASETAHRRGARVLAELALLASSSSPRDLVRALPAPDPESWIALTEASPETTAPLKGSAWDAVERRLVDERAGWHDDLGGIDLAASAAAVARGDARQIVLWTRRETQWYVAVLVGDQRTAR
jgi:3-oxoacyl-(acyl-carrier-protein) synthase